MAKYWHGQWTDSTFYEGGVDMAVVQGPAGYDTKVYINLWGSDHVSSSDTRPETGAHWADYWQSIYFAWMGPWSLSTFYTGYSPQSFVTHSNAAWYCIGDHTSSASDEPGVGVDWEDYWRQYAQEVVIETDPWLGFALVGSLFIPVFYTVTLQGSLLVTDGDGKLVYRIGAFEEQHGVYDAIEDILGDAGVTFD